MGLLKRFRRQEIRADPDETMFELTLAPKEKKKFRLRC